MRRPIPNAEIPEMNTDRIRYKVKAFVCIDVRGIELATVTHQCQPEEVTA